MGLSACKLVSLSACKLASFKLAHLGACELVYYWNAHYTKNAWTNLVCCKPDWVTPYKSSFSSSFFSSNKKWQKKIVSALTFVVSDWGHSQLCRFPCAAVFLIFAAFYICNATDKYKYKNHENRSQLSRAINYSQSGPFWIVVYFFSQKNSLMFYQFLLLL